MTTDNSAPFSAEVLVVLEAAPDAMIITDSQARIVLVNAQAERVFGYPRAELLGQQIEILVPESFRGAHVPARTGYVHQPRSRQMGDPAADLFARRRDGGVFPAEISLSPLRTQAGLFVIAAVRDLTVRRRMEAKFRVLLEAAPDAMVITDRAHYINLVNAQAERLFGYRRAELIGRPVEMLLPERFRPVQANPDEQLEPRPHPLGLEDPEFALCRKDGTEVYAEVLLRPLDTEEGSLTIAAIRDVTDRKKAEMERAHYLEAREGIRVRDEFLSIASHELKTPLTSLLMNAQVLLRLSAPGSECVNPERLYPKAQALERTALRLRDLVGDLLDVSRITAGRLNLETAEVDLAALVDQVADRLLDEAATAGCRIRIDHPEAVVGHWDAARMDQVVTNLLSNALKYGEGRDVHASLSAEAGVAKLVVRDQGIGIAAEDQARIFQRFERAVSGRNYGGFGLGLWIVRSIVEAHGGTVSVESSPSEGSTFTVELPLGGPPASAELGGPGAH